MEYNTPDLILSNQKEIEEKIAYKFGSHTNLLIQAFTRKSYAQENDDFEHNEILEFYGDHLVNTVITKWLFDSYSKLPNSNSFANEYFSSEKDESELTRIRAKYANKSALAHCIDILDLDQYLLLGKSDEKNEVWKSEKVRCDLFESIIGAIAVDSIKNKTLYSKNKEWDFEQIEKSCKKMWEMLDFSENYISSFYDMCEDYNLHYKYSSSNYYICTTNQKQDCTLYLYNQSGQLLKELVGSGNSELSAKMDAAKNGIAFLKSFELKEYLSNATLDNAVQTLNTLYLKKKISKPELVPIQKSNDNGNHYWRFECYIDEFKDYEGYNQAGIGEASTKAEAKKIAANSMIKFLLQLFD